MAISGAVALWYILAVMVLALSGGSHRKTMDTLVKVIPSKAVLAPGQTFTVSVSVEPAAGTNVAGFQFNLAFNAQAFRVDSVAEGTLLKQLGLPTFFNGGTIDNQAGTLKPVYGAIEGAGSVTTPGTMAVLSCTALTAGQSSAFALSNVIVGNMDAHALPLEPFGISQMQVGGKIRLSGSVSAQEKAGEPVLITITKPDGTPDSVSTSTDATKAFTVTYVAPVGAGYKAAAVVAADALFKAAQSLSITFQL